LLRDHLLSPQVPGGLVMAAQEDDIQNRPRDLGRSSRLFAQLQRTVHLHQALIEPQPRGQCGFRRISS
jgi:hypothetical protein